MKREFVPVKRQVFEIGRTINPFLCDCEKCDIFHCPKHNYALKMEYKKYSVQEYFERHLRDLLTNNQLLLWQTSFPCSYMLKMTYDDITNFIDECIKFSKGLYWDINCYDTSFVKSVRLVKFSKKGQEQSLATIDVRDGSVFYTPGFDVSNRQQKTIQQISGFIRKLKFLLCDYFKESEKDNVVGWLSPEGRHYPCRNGHHNKICNELGISEVCAERDGWVKVVSDDTYFGTYLSAEQRNWLSMNGFEVD